MSLITVASSWRNNLLYALLTRASYLHKWYARPAVQVCFCCAKQAIDRHMILQENNFQQPGERYRSWDPRRRERFVNRISEVVGHPRTTKVRFLSNPVMHSAALMCTDIEMTMKLISSFASRIMQLWLCLLCHIHITYYWACQFCHLCKFAVTRLVSMWPILLWVFARALILIVDVYLQEIRRIWIGYLSQCDVELGRKVAAKLQSQGSL